MKTKQLTPSTRRMEGWSRIPGRDVRRPRRAAKVSGPCCKTIGRRRASNLNMIIVAASRTVSVRDFERLEATPSYLAGLANVKTIGPDFIAALGPSAFSCRSRSGRGLRATFERLADEIAIWAASEDWIAELA